MTDSGAMRLACALVLLAAGNTAPAADFPLVVDGRATTVYVSPSDHAVVHLAAADLAGDIERVAGALPRLASDAAVPAEPLVLIGTLGASPPLDRLVASKRLDVGDVAGKWETFVIAAVDRPLPGVPRALVIAGSDRRGTAFGVYELSREIGISPWHFWADVNPTKRSRLQVPVARRRQGPPSVKYRGIFINDEDWGLQPWAARTFEPETGDIGPKTYAKVFELLLRLKANTLWPAMHRCTKPFNHFPENAPLADRYGIVMGSSHAEPMLRNNVGEWTAPPGDYDYTKNADGVRAYWEERLRTNGRYENVYTLGMRGIHDSGMQGAKTDAERVALLERIFTDQRSLLAQHVHPAVETVPQMFCAYKEVLELYRAGLKVPDDVTIVWPDDNFGYVRNAASPEERKRKGGFGVYYHVSYLGRPLSYLWLNTTPPALIWEEMSKSYDHGADRIWIVNVGDIKPAEIATDFFLQMAWDVGRWRRDTVPRFLEEWSRSAFGPEHAAETAAVLTEYYRLNWERKPEHLQWWLPGEMPKGSPFTPAEVNDRLGAFHALQARADRLQAAVPAEKRDAFYQIVTYPVRGAALANERYFAAEAYGRRFDDDNAAARAWGARARAADAGLRAETRYFNEELSGGKWRHILALEPADNQWRSMRIAPLPLPDENVVAPSIGDLPAPPAARPSGERPLVIEAEAFARRHPAAGVSWDVISGIGRGSGAVALFPTTTRGGDNAPPHGARLEYDIDFDTAGDWEVAVQLVPTHPLVPGRGLRFALGVAGSPGPIVAAAVADGSPEWAQGVLASHITVRAAVTVPAAGRQTLALHGVDGGVVIDRLLLQPKR